MIIIQFINKSINWHRKNGPVNFNSNGYIEYCLNGKFHREDGPAVIWADGLEEYWLNGNRYNKESYYNQLKELYDKNTI